MDWLNQLFRGDYYLTRFIFQRALALVYVLAFSAVLHQFKPLLGDQGLMPVQSFVRSVPFRKFPSLFYFWPTNQAFTVFGWIGLALSLIALMGLSESFGLPFSMITWALLWMIYLSFVNVGQTFYGFGWESMLLETGFLTIFLGDINTRVPIVMIWLLRWVLFRDMFGAGLIKLRVDRCWRDLTCLDYHYETQPLPNPLSWYFHWSPRWFLKFGVLFNHLVEVIVPFFYFFVDLPAAVAGGLTILFQAMLMVSGNFAFLNFLTIVLSISTFNDTLLIQGLPFLSALTPAAPTLPPMFLGLVLIVLVLVVLLSVQPILNLISPAQRMNSSFEPLHLVNTYGAFGVITRDRNEIVIEGTDDTKMADSTVWKEYAFIAKPGDPARRPPQIAPYHLRLDWLMWFAAMAHPYNYPWFIHLLGKLLQGDKAILRLLANNPFPDHPPNYVRALLYRYQFTTPQERGSTHNWWKRTLLGVYFPPISRQSVRLEATQEAAPQAYRNDSPLD